MRSNGIETQRDKNTRSYPYIKVYTVTGERYYYNKTYFIGVIGSGGLKQTHKLVLSSKILCAVRPKPNRGRRRAH